MQAEQLELFNPNRLPQAPYCTRGKGEAVVIRRLQSALRNPLIQINLPVLTWWLVFDIDHPQAAVAWQDAGLPPPNWVAVNPSNGHAHMVYGLSRGHLRKRNLKYVKAESRQVANGTR